MSVAQNPNAKYWWSYRQQEAVFPMDWPSFYIAETAFLLEQSAKQRVEDQERLMGWLDRYNELLDRYQKLLDESQSAVGG